uniref:Microtubule-associated protein 9 n=1 Tax=Amazona collaria TaxID=241587 RepID=A0A8B9F9H0_9PSIT
GCADVFVVLLLPKLFVKPFQAELQKAITAHAAREQAAEYSDDFESDKDNMRNGKTKLNILPCSENVSIPSLDTCSRPTPRRRSMLRKSGPVEDRSERKITSRKEFSSVSASSSLTVKNAQATSKKNLLAKSPGEDTLLSATVNGRVVNMFVSWYFYRSLVSAHLKKKAKAVPSATPASSQCMGTLKVLEDKHVQKNSTEFNKADSLRAAVFQNWLEMKKHFLRESKRIEKEKAENLRNNIEKKEAIKREEAIASFEAWKRKKVREAKKLRQKKKLEELQKNEAAEQNTDKSEAAQKAFEKWKEKKMEYLREQSRKEKQSESRKKKKEEELVAQKKRDSMSAVEKWYYSTGVWNIIVSTSLFINATGLLPQLEYCVQLWDPPKKREVDLLKGVQRRPQK